MGNSQPKLDPKEEAKQQKRTIQRAIRQIDRERGKMQNQEAKTLREIKALAQKNQHVSLEKSNASFRVLQKSWQKISFDRECR